MINMIFQSVFSFSPVNVHITDNTNKISVNISQQKRHVSKMYVADYVQQVLWQSFDHADNLEYQIRYYRLYRVNVQKVCHSSQQTFESFGQNYHKMGLYNQ